ncbi:hypothetical protein SEA_BAUER_46 [Arthrobacter phage Bauer]|uniref:Uncharacterized protein n=1 Tax=Arthrobacter phage Bauer TaxID=2985648 RepID=A0A9E7V2K3_9CAUD|nr:hypothetical protein QEO99_gp46 [Arthrobacter phage Bauer]UYM26595.1 hypothetical protein SEA_BAUER_46 [Arthrobacter phage Bauer]
MPKIPPFVELKNLFRDAAKAAGQPISAREAHRQAQGFMLSNAVESREDEAYFRGISDETGEEAVKNVLIEYLRKYGTLRGPVAA